MRAFPLAVFLIGPMLLGTATPVVLGKSVSQSDPVTSAHFFWTGRMRSEEQQVRITQNAPSKKIIARTALRQRKTTHALRAELLTNESPSVAQRYSSSLLPTMGVTQSSTSSHSTIQPFNNFFPVLDQPEILLKHRLIANEMLRIMPEKCHSTLKNFYVRYDDSGQRGVAGKESIVMGSSNVDDQEFRALFVHEFGHVLDLGCFQGNPSTGASAFKDGNDIMWNDDPSLIFYRISWQTSNVQKEGMKPEDFVTGYGSWDVFEDLAEALNYYVFQRKAFLARARTNHVMAMKLAWIETYVFPGGKTIAKGEHQWNGEVPWDSTKLPYAWVTSE